MKRAILSAICGAALLAAMIPTGAMAAKNPEQKSRFKQSIKKGVKSGKLTRPEAKQLKAEMKAFRAEVKAAKANGNISPEDRARLKAERNRLKGEIKAQKNDAQIRNPN
jgi:hypothetical protein